VPEEYESRFFCELKVSMFPSTTSEPETSESETSEIEPSISTTLTKPNKKGLSTGAIAGIAIGSVGLVAIIVIIIFVTKKKKDSLPLTTIEPLL